MDSHRVDLRTLTFQHDFGDVQHLPELTSSMLDRILSIRIRLNRSIQGYPMIAKLTEEQLGEIEDRFRSEAIEHFDNDLQGNYQSLKDIPEGDGQRENFFSRKPINRQRESAGVYRHWPTGRGVYLNREENFYVWVNEEDHLSLISQSRHSQIRDTYGRLQRAMEKVNQVFDFQQHPRLGYLNFSPLNIGTALQIDIQLRFAHPEKVDAAMEFCRKRDIRLAATNEKNVVDLSNVIRLGRTEFHLVRGMIDTVERLLEISEKEKQEH